MRKFVLCSIAFFLIYGCIERLDVPIISNAPVLVVDGMISDQEGPYTVKLFWSSPLDTDLDHAKPVAGATVTISDDVGNSETLHERIPGTYETNENGIRGQVGRKYQLRIISEEGKVYESESALMTSAGQIKDLFFEFREDVINSTDPTRPQDAFSVQVNSEGVDGASNLFRWRWTGIYHVRTFPELKTKYVQINGETTAVPDPLPCSGYITNDTYDLIYVKPCECCDCYVYEYSNDAIISSNNVINGNEFRNVHVAQIPADKRRFYEKYYIEVEQLSLSESVYDFWKVVARQQQSAGDIFQPNVVKVRGNLRSVSNDDEEVFGIFSVSAVTKKSIFIHRNDIRKVVAPIDTITGDCRHSFFNSTTERPPFW